MKRLVMAVLAACLLFSQPALAEDGNDANFAQYNVQVGFSPFGGSLNFGYNVSSRTSWNFVLGGLPAGVLELEQDIGGTKYTHQSNASWVGAFLSHRPIESARWFRVVAGFGIGRIQNELTDANGNTYSADYTGNPVGYLGVGFGGKAEKGFIYGLDIGWLQTGGPDIKLVEGTADAKAMADIKDHIFFGSVLPNVQLTLGYGF
ncbi:MAG TPA: hypothetical protein DCQ06_04100 [Myxococcales bacterium]|nr:hypothetical protein [Myxococcales bacterium]HAN30757.1 hypothetical protein [Myxococcales bacterium]